ncbi:MAG: FAD:protein FMN transferase [Gammaproteobacteria bacterium]|nr:FAD:protein FMN transferase [Gammaproteobacteria bacterium]
MIKLSRRHSFVTIFLVLILVSVLYFTDGGEDIQKLSGRTMGTSYQVQIVDMPRELAAEELAADIDELLSQLDTGIFSTYASNSELSRFNRHGVNSPFAASAQMIEVLLLAQEISALSGGAFDVTVGPLVNLWGFGPNLAVFETVPTQLQIEAAQNLVGFQFLRISPANQEIRKTRDVYVDLSAIAKGYAVDQLAEYLDQLGIANYFLEIGGELKIKGSKPGGAGWVPAIEAPVDTASQVYQIFYSRGDNIAVAGSGDYRNYFEEEGVRYSHEIDPRNGRPVIHNLAAAYVIDESTARADALATTYMILGPDAAEALASKQGQAVYFIYKSDESGFEDYVSPEFNRYLENDLQ